MSLDVTLYSQESVQKVKGTGIFVRENGGNVELTVEQVKEKFPNFEFDETPDVVYENSVFDYNITHNLGKMAGECGLYEVMWRPYMLHPDFTTEVDEYEFESNHTMKASDIEQKLSEGLKELVDNPEKYKEYNPENGWGSYEGLVKFGQNYLEAVKAYPDSIIEVSR